MDRKKISVCEPYLNGKEIEYVMDAVSTGWISSSGQYVTKFEEAFSKYCGVSHGISVCNGTVAIHLALVALGIGKGDEVIIPSFTMIATAFAVCYVGATPVFVDADKNTWNIDVRKIEEKITSRTKAIIPVHVFGNPCNMDAILEIAEKHHLLVVEDAAEAHGATFRGRKVGSFSDIACFSFFANKNVTTGEGGMCVTNDDQYAKLCRYYKNVCFNPDGPRDYLHQDIGFNYRMSNLHAAIGLAQTERADEYKKMRMVNHNLYKKFLEDIPGIIVQKDEDYSENVGWMNTIVVEPEKYGKKKDELISKLHENGIDTRLLFKSMHIQPSLRKYGCDCSGNYPVTVWLSENGFYLPSASNLSEDDILFICNIIRQNYESSIHIVGGKE